VFPRFEPRIDQFQETRNDEFISPFKSNKLRQLEGWLREYHLQLGNQKRVKRGDKLICTRDIWGACPGHEPFEDKLLADDEIEEFRF
jgi:hypothetical protein